MVTSTAKIDQILSLIRELSHESRILLMQRILQTFLPNAEPAPHTNGQAESFFSQHPQRHQMLQEESAFEAMLGELQSKYLGQYVAIHQGKLVDHAQDAELLVKRVEGAYPNQIILIRQVFDQPEPPLVFRSPRFIENT